MNEQEIVEDLTIGQTTFIKNAVAQVWQQKVDKMEKIFDNCVISVYRIHMVLRVDIKLTGVQHEARINRAA